MKLNDEKVIFIVDNTQRQPPLTGSTKCAAVRVPMSKKIPQCVHAYQ
jgi:hypothetical protein